MKKLLILILILSSCATKKPIVTTTVINGDTIVKTEYVSLTRQERLVIKDSLKHEFKLAKVERLVIRDSIKYVYKTKWIDRIRYKDSIKWVVKEKKQENKHVQKMEKKTKWWVWMLFGLLIASLGLNTLFIIRK